MSELTASMLLRGADQKLAVIRVELIKDLGTQIAPRPSAPPPVPAT